MNPAAIWKEIESSVKLEAAKRNPLAKAKSTPITPSMDSTLKVLLLWIVSAKAAIAKAIMPTSIKKWLVKIKLPPLPRKIRHQQMHCCSEEKSSSEGVTNRLLAIPTRNCAVNKTKSTNSVVDRALRSIFANKQVFIEVLVEKVIFNLRSTNL